MSTVWLALGSLLGGLGVVLGAFGAHALRGKLAADLEPVFRTAVDYHFYHALALLAVGLVARGTPGPWVNTSGAAFTAGIIIFSGSLYLLAITGVRAWGAVTPIGGLAFIIGWVCLAMGALRA